MTRRKHEQPHEAELAIEQIEEQRDFGHIGPAENALVQTMSEDELRMVAARLAAMPRTDPGYMAFQRLYQEALRARTMESVYRDQVALVRKGTPKWKRPDWQAVPDPNPERK